MLSFSQWILSLSSRVCGAGIHYMPSLHGRSIQRFFKVIGALDGNVCHQGLLVMWLLIYLHLWSYVKATKIRLMAHCSLTHSLFLSLSLSLSQLLMQFGVFLVSVNQSTPPTTQALSDLVWPHPVEPRRHWMPEPVSFTQDSTQLFPSDAAFLLWQGLLALSSWGNFPQCQMPVAQ